MPAKTAQLELKTDAILGEGAIWDHRSGVLYWIDIEACKLHRYDPRAKTNRTFTLPSRIGTVVPTVGEREAVIGLEDGVYLIDTQTGTQRRLAPIELDLPGNRLNDGKCDPAGRLWVGSMSIAEEPHAGALYRVDPDGTVTQHLQHISISNGIVWTSDQRTMYYIDTPTRQVWGYDFDPIAGTISRERIAVLIDPALGYPDGMTIDAEDMIWVALWEGSAVIRFDPTTGQLLEKIKVPALKVTSCAFGGPELDRLYITTASINMTPEQHEQYPDAGSIFVAEPGVRGVERSFFG